MNKYKLKNGITVIMDSIPHYASVSFGIWVKAGSVNETNDNNGVAHAIEHMVFKGTKNRTAKEIADVMTEIGGNLDAFTSKEYTCFYAKTLTEHLPTAIDILSDMLINSLIDENDLKKELGVICEEIDMYDDSPEDIVHEQLQKTFWEDHPLGFLISGEKERVQQFTRDDLISFMNQYYTGSRTVVSIAGNFDEQATLKLLEKSFADMPAGDREIGMSNNHLKKPVYTPSLYVQYKDIEQVHMIIAYEQKDYYDPEKMILGVANCIIGGNMNSRLFMKVREEMGIAYSIYSYGGAYEQAGMFYVYAAVHPQQVKSVIEETYELIESLKKELVSERELYIVKQQIKTELIIAQESTYNQMARMGKVEIHGIDYKTVDALLAEIEQVSREQILEYMNKNFDPERISISLVGDIKEENQLIMKDLWNEIRNRGSKS